MFTRHLLLLAGTVLLLAAGLLKSPNEWDALATQPPVVDQGTDSRAPRGFAAFAPLKIGPARSENFNSTHLLFPPIAKLC